MKDSTRRALRTFIDLFLGILGSLAVVGVVPGFSDFMTDHGWGSALATFSIVVLVLTSVFTKFKNYLEDNTNFPAFLKAPSSEGQNPQPDPPQNPVD
jgi:hypothetical protein